MKHKLWVVLLGSALSAAVAKPAYALDSIYVGAQVGHVALTGGAGVYSNSLGFGGEIAFRTNPILDVALRSQYSSHAGGAGLGLWSNTLSADFLVGNFNDIEFFLGGGPGFYQFAQAAKASRFGLHAEAYGDLAVGKNLKLGLSWRYHGVFDPAAGEGSYWTIMMRAGFTFPMGS